MAGTADGARLARDTMTARSRACMAEYARDWPDRPVKHAARHFGVSYRTIVRWRALLGISGSRQSAGR
jgi:hypothetical protein